MPDDLFVDLCVETLTLLAELAHSILEVLRQKMALQCLQLADFYLSRLSRVQVQGERVLSSALLSKINQSRPCLSFRENLSHEVRSVVADYFLYENLKVPFQLRAVRPLVALLR